MSAGTKIQWADDTHNFWQGCTKVSAGCANCYAEARDRRFHGGTHWGKGATRVRSKDFEAPVKWNKRLWVCDTCGEAYATMPFACCGTAEFHRRRVFSLSLGDWLDDEVPIEWLADMLRLIHETRNLDWLLLTKRPENWCGRITAAVCEFDRREDWVASNWLTNWFARDGNPPNVWLGVSVEDQETADERIPQLLKIPAAVRFLSAEPLLGPVKFEKWIVNVPREVPPDPDIDWVIVGGESGAGARTCEVQWIRDIVWQCKDAGVPCFVKQLGTDARDGSLCCHGCSHTGPHPLSLRHPKGGDPAEWPEDLRVREFPRVSHEGAKEAKA